MATRAQLHSKLEALPGVEKVYFCPPETLKLTYPCIIYRLSGIEDTFADNEAYHSVKAYSVTLISKEPNFQIVDAINLLPHTKMERYYSSNNLHHYTFKLYF